MRLLAAVLLVLLLAGCRGVLDEMISGQYNEYAPARTPTPDGAGE